MEKPSPPKKLPPDFFDTHKEWLSDLLFDHSLVCKAFVGLDGSWLQVNKALCDFLGYSERELFKLTFQDITHEDDLAKDLALVKELIEGRIDYYWIEKRYITKAGGITWGKLGVTLARKNGEPIFFLSHIVDINHMKELEADLRGQIITDPMTGVYNRVYFAQQLSHYLSRKSPVALIYVDLNGLKVINDTEGHLAGDKLICDAAKTLQDSVRQIDLVARLGGDEFAIVCPGLDAVTLESRISDIRNALATKKISAAFGVAFSGPDKAMAELIQEADNSMYEDKRIKNFRAKSR